MWLHHTVVLSFLIQAARARGVDCVVAPYEADAQLAYLTKWHLAQAVITEDSDLLAFGCKKVADAAGGAQRLSSEVGPQLQSLSLSQALQPSGHVTLTYMSSH